MKNSNTGFIPKMPWSDCSGELCPHISHNSAEADIGKAPNPPEEKNSVMEPQGWEEGLQDLIEKNAGEMTTDGKNTYATINVENMAKAIAPYISTLLAQERKKWDDKEYDRGYSEAMQYALAVEKHWKGKLAKEKEAAIEEYEGKLKCLRELLHGK